jgi:hypothetical protein
LYQYWGSIGSTVYHSAILEQYKIQILLQHCIIIIGPMLYVYCFSIVASQYWYNIENTIISQYLLPMIGQILAGQYNAKIV